MSTHSAAMRLLMLCRPDADEARRRKAAALPAPEWEHLLQVARWHGMTPLLATQLLSQTPLRGDAPEAILKALRGHRERQFLRAMTQTAALVELWQAFAREGVRVLSWKGPALAVLLYGAATLREGGDLDFQLDRRDIHKVLEITRSLGYALSQQVEDKERILYILEGQGEFCFDRARDGVALEFHTQTLPSRFRLWQGNKADLARASTVCRIGDAEVRMQRPEEMLVSLCAHGTKHGWNRLKWSCDIAQFLSVHGSTLDWGPFLAELRRTKRLRVILLGLELASLLFEIDLPAAVEKSIRSDRAVEALAREVADHLLGGSLEPMPERLQWAMTVLLCPGLWHRAVYRLYPVVRLNYIDLYVPVQNRRLALLNYPLRLLRLLGRYGPYRLTAKAATAIRSVR